MALKPGLPLERHREIGAELFAIRNRLLKLAVEIGRTHPKKSAEARRSLKALRAVDALRCELDNLVCGLPDGRPEVYYPGPETYLAGN